MQALRRFEVQVVKMYSTDGLFTPDTDYPVLAMDKEGDDLYLLLADDDSDLAWVPWTGVKVTNIE